MRLLHLVIPALVWTVCVPAHAEGIVQPLTGPLHLFNGHNIDGWVPYSADSDAKLGENWEIREDGVLHCTGTAEGYLRTKRAYANYRLTLEWRWPDDAGDGGVLVHVQDHDRLWPDSIETGLTSGEAGDLWLLRTSADERAETGRRAVKHEASSENRPGRWNTLEIVCGPDAIEVSVNGVFQNRATHPTVQFGYIALQSVGTPIEFRNIVLHPLKEPARTEAATTPDNVEAGLANKDS